VIFVNVKFTCAEKMLAFLRVLVLLVLAVATAWSAEENAAAPKKDPAACWKDAEDRGRGVLPEHGQCANNLERSMG